MKGFLDEFLNKFRQDPIGEFQKEPTENFMKKFAKTIEMKTIFNEFHEANLEEMQGRIYEEVLENKSYRNSSELWRNF